MASNLKLRVENLSDSRGDRSHRKTEEGKRAIAKELELSAMQAKIQTQAKEEMGKTHREYFLRNSSKRFSPNSAK